MIETFKPPFIFWTEIPNHKQIKEKYLPQIKKSFEENKEDMRVARWNCEDSYSSIDVSTPYLRDNEFVDSVIWNPLDEMLSEVDLCMYPSDSELSNIWFNYYVKGGYQEVHIHDGSNFPSFSGIYLMDVNEPNTTGFIVMDQIHYLNSTVLTKDIKEGSVILFPSNLPHYVNPVKDNRYTVSFNIISRFP